MNEELKKALEALIEETISEIDELKKSRFAASEIKIEGPGDGIDGKPTNGKIEKDEDEEEDEDEDDKDMDKGEGKNKEADPGSVHKEEDAEKSEGKNKEADPGSVHKAEDKKDEKEKDAKGGEDHEKKEKKAISKLAELADMDKAEDKMGYMKGAIAKSQDEVSSLMKSYIDEKVLPLENKLSSLLDLVTKIAEQPVAPKGATARYQALTKSADEKEALSKSEVSAKLFELKKSGSIVDTMDVTKAELGQDLQAIVKKYNLA